MSNGDARFYKFCAAASTQFSGFLKSFKHDGRWAVVVAKLVERSLPTPEVRGSNPTIDENKEKRGWEWPIFNMTSAGCKTHRSFSLFSFASQTVHNHSFWFND